jgi:hypothetical protein
MATYTTGSAVDPIVAWKSYLDELSWANGDRHNSMYDAGLRAASLKIDKETAFDEVIARIVAAGAEPKHDEVRRQLDRAYKYAGEQAATVASSGGHRPTAKQPKLAYEPAKLEAMASRLGFEVTDEWLAARSALPTDILPAEFLNALYEPGENVIVFDAFKSQGQSVYKHGSDANSLDGFRVGRQEGVWFLNQPVDGEYHANDEGNQSRRSKESVTSWRYLVVESDKVPTDQWLKMLVQQPLRIAAITFSGKKSIHALVRVDASSKEDFDRIAEPIKKALVPVGADQGAMSAVRLTRLPNCTRGETGQVQKLLYLNPDPDGEPIAGKINERNSVENEVLEEDAILDDNEKKEVGIIIYVPERGMSYYVMVGNFSNTERELESTNLHLELVSRIALALRDKFNHIADDLTDALRDKKFILEGDATYLSWAARDPVKAKKAVDDPEKVEKFVKPYLDKRIEREKASLQEFEESRAEMARNYAAIEGEFPSPMNEAAFIGIAGEIVDIIAPESEASREALLTQFLAAFGNIMGSGAHCPQAGWHRLNEFLVIVGETSRGRKGTSWKAITNLLEMIDPEWTWNRIVSGIQSGEAIISAVRDPAEEQASSVSKKPGSAKRSIDDVGVEDKRLLLMEEEFSRLLTSSGRSQNTLSPTIRTAFDNPNVLRVVGKHFPEKATKAHISLIGHITREELKSSLKAVDQENGFANRVIWIASQRSKKLPCPGWIAWENHPTIIKKLREIIEIFSLEVSPKGRRMAFSQPAEALWIDFYNSIDDVRTGVMQKLTARAEAHVLRLSMIYAVLDKSASIEPKHLNAAIAVWSYSEASVKWAFGSSSGNPAADKILEELKRKPNGMTRTEIQAEVFHRHCPASDLSQALRYLRENKLADFNPEKPANGKTIERWSCCK